MCDLTAIKSSDYVYLTNKKTVIKIVILAQELLLDSISWSCYTLKDNRTYILIILFTDSPDRNMKLMIFSEIVQLHLQGDPALRFLEIQYSSYHGLPYAKFQILGFEQPEIFIQDYRPKTLAVIEQIQLTGEATRFPDIFNMPAQASFYATQGNKPTILTLHPTNEMEPQLVLWIVSDIGDEIPAYEYLYRHASNISPERFAFMALFQKHTTIFQAAMSCPSQINTQIQHSC